MTENPHTEREVPPAWADLLSQEFPGTWETFRPNIRMDAPQVTPPRQANVMPWAEVLAMIARAEEAAATRLVLGPAKWDAILARATDEERALLERGRESGQIIVSPYLPEPETAYRIQIPALPPWRGMMPR